jgi:hypothetical protein
MAPQLQKSQFRVQVLVGPHVTKQHAMNIKRAILDFNPHIYVFENNTMLESQRRGLNANMRSWVDMARRGGKRQIMEQYRSNNRSNPHLEYEAAQVEHIISGSNKAKPVPHMAEGYCESEIRSLAQSDARLNDAYVAALRLIGESRLEEALGIIRNAEREHARNYTHLRIGRTVENFPELLDMTPGMLGLNGLGDEVRVLVRYGSFHEAIADRLKKDGFDAALSQYSEYAPGILQTRLGHDMNASLPDDDLLMSIFVNLRGIVAPSQMNLSVREMSHVLDGALNMCGGVRGVAMLVAQNMKDAAGDMGKFFEKMRKALQ